MTDANLPQTLRLIDVPAGTAGRRLGLRGGDLLVAVNGRAFAGDVGALGRMFEGAALAALTFQRGGAEFTLLAGTATLGRWESVPAPADDPARRRIDPAFLHGWEVMRAGDGSYDLIARHLPATAYVAPQLWLMQMRLWLPCAMLVAAVAAGFIVHPALALAVHAAGVAHLRWSHALYQRLDRRGRGLSFHMMIAARTEAAAHAAHRALHPGDRYLFAPQPKRTEAVTA